MFYKIVERLCMSKGISITKLSEELGLSSSVVTGWKNGAAPRKSTLKKIADYFGVSPDYLLGDSPKSNKGVMIPLLGTVPAGIPIEAIENVLDYEEISSDLAATGEFFALLVQGDSMSPNLIDGDVVVIRQTPDVESGCVAIVLVNGSDATIKRLQKHEHGITLLPDNPMFKPIFFTEKEIAELPVVVIGQVVELRRKKNL